ncbi:hypothetical protein [Paraflavitalea pollutisoli]|uniref:hypothetical protein n=1 Tax=Paraflavitalea pollutisoli TaxID=3034143 RepID=UPI0023EB5E53|nr:hypothetical protein [Paraflavitalea sp. H1-2-19X]
MTKITPSPVGAPAYRPGINPQAWRLILQAGLLAGTCDIVAAFVNYSLKTGKSPWPILNYIASGVVGKEAAYEDVIPMRVLGMALHFLIATIFAAIFYAAWPTIKKLTSNWVLAGLGYGIVVWCAMNLVVVPLSNTPAGKHTTSGVIINMLILMFCIGLPVAGIIARRR